MNSFPYLSFLIWLPILSGLFIALAPKQNAVSPKSLSILIAVATLVLSGFVVFKFLGGEAGFLLKQEADWIPRIGASYLVGVDSMAAWMMLLTAFLGLIAILISKPKEKLPQFLGLLLCLEGTLFGIFSSLDIVLFYVFFELSLIPVALMILGWGTGDKGKVAIRYVATLFAGSLLMLVGMAILASRAIEITRVPTFSVLRLQELVANQGLWKDSWPLQSLAFWGFMIAFLVKSPVVPIHRWLNDTYEDAPIGAVIAGVVLKVGTFGMFRFCLPLFPDACKAYAPIVVGIGVVGIIYGGILAAIQKTPGRVMGFSTISHVGFILVGMFSLNHYGMMGAAFQQFNHGIAAAAVFVMLSFLAERSPSKSLEDFGGLKKSMPIFSTLFLIAMLTNLGLPFTGGFIGEFLALVGSYFAGHVGSNGLNVGFTYIAASGAILSASYMLYMYQRLFYGRNVKTQNYKDLDTKETVIGGSFAIIILILGILPMTILRSMEPNIKTLSSSYEASGSPSNTSTQVITEAK
ncbi:MAG: NADH-quinone oxidoreductase subunit M [Armatimonadota bacterium]